MSETASVSNVTELWEGIAEKPVDVPLVDLLDQLNAYGNKYKIGIACVVEMPGGSFRTLTPIGARRVWSVGALEYLKKDIMRGC